MELRRVLIRSKRRAGGTWWARTSGLRGERARGASQLAAVAFGGREQGEQPASADEGHPATALTGELGDGGGVDVGGARCGRLGRRRGVGRAGQVRRGGGRAPRRQRADARAAAERRKLRQRGQRLELVGVDLSGGGW